MLEYLCGVRRIFTIALVIGLFPSLAWGQTPSDSLRKIDLESVLIVAQPIDKAYEVLREAGRRNRPLPSFSCSTAVKSSYGSGSQLKLREALSISLFAEPGSAARQGRFEGVHNGQRPSRAARLGTSIGL